MSDADVQLDDFAQLRRYVYQALCEQSELEPGVFPMSERVLIRGGRSCGVSFCLHGPRSVKTTAIWETDCQTILFYNAVGERIEKISLAASPPPPRIAA
jgi:hypothetical protein